MSGIGEPLACLLSSALIVAVVVSAPTLGAVVCHLEPCRAIGRLAFDSLGWLAQLHCWCKLGGLGGACCSGCLSFQLCNPIEVGLPFFVKFGPFFHEDPMQLVLCEATDYAVC